jgi:hypothetical protein
MFGTILGAFFGVAGIVGVIECVGDLVRGRQSRKWPTVPAQILESTVSYRSGGRGGGRFVPVVGYRYSVNGVSYVGRRVQFTRLESISRADAERVIRKFHPENSVLVRVSPSDPRISVIQPGQHGRSWLYLLLFAVFAALGVGLMSGALK